MSNDLLDFNKDAKEVILSLPLGNLIWSVAYGTENVKLHHIYSTFLFQQECFGIIVRELRDFGKLSRESMMALETGSLQRRLQRIADGVEIACAHLQWDPADLVAKDA